MKIKQPKTIRNVNEKKKMRSKTFKTEFIVAQLELCTEKAMLRS